jgi:hypothetical protein
MMKRVALLEAQMHPVTTVMNSLKKALPTETAEPQHSEDQLVPNIDRVVGQQTAVQVNIPVANPLYYIPGQQIFFPRTGETARVTNAPGTSPITVTRSWGPTPPAVLLDGEILWILGDASPEGNNSRIAINTLEVPYTEMCQVIRNSIEATEVGMGTRTLGNDFEDQVEKKLIEHKRQMEYFMKLGTRARVQEGAQWTRTMGSLNERIQINRALVGGVLGEGTWEAIVERAGQFGNARKLALMGSTAYRAVSNMARNRLVTVPEDESYGLRLRRYEGDITIDIIRDRELKGSVLGGWIMIIDPDYLVVRYLFANEGSNTPAKYTGAQYTKRVENIQANDLAGRKDEWYSCCCLQMIQEQVHLIAEDIRG